MNYLTFIIIIILFFSSCTEKIDFDLQPVNYMELEVERGNDGTNSVLVEKDDKLSQKDDIVFKDCNYLLYEFQYIKNNEEKLFQIYSPAFIEENSWDFINISDNNPEKTFIKHVGITSLSYNIPQILGTSAINISYINNIGDTIISSRTSIIENHKNLWMHFPRHGIFKNIFSAPWPYFKFPLEINKHWNWKWNFDDTWGDSRYVKWEGIAEFQYSYTVIGTEVITLPFGTAKCYVIDAKGNSSIGANSAIFYYHPRLGVLKVHYTLLDNSTLIMQAVEKGINCDLE